MPYRRATALIVLALTLALARTASAAPLYNGYYYYPPPQNPSVTGQAPQDTTPGHQMTTQTIVIPRRTRTATSGSTITSPAYDLDWTLPTAGKSGCLVCHGDPGLVRIIDGQTVNLYVDSEVLKTSAHKNITCTDCHLDFAYKAPHGNVVSNGDAWKAIAKSSCQNCHKDALLQYANSAHSPANRTGTSTSPVGAPDSSAPGKPKPLCGDCHGGHDIPAKDDKQAQREEHASAAEVCGQCHEKWASDYSDYYHGAAYARGAPDAPACWQCHNTHLILPSSDRNSWTNPDNLVTTCGQCHLAANRAYTAYGQFVHHRRETLQANPVYKMVSAARSAVYQALHVVSRIFNRSGS
jgi:hypothetical protein